VAPRKDLLTTAQAARELGISPRTLARYAQRGILVPTMVLPSGHRRWDMDDLRRQLREQRERDE
jgi:DNA-binding transcriptional MerR regulator